MDGGQADINRLAKPAGSVENDTQPTKAGLKFRSAALPGVISSAPLHAPWEGRMAIHIRRREFIATLGGATAAWTLAARTQQPKVPTIGALVIGNIDPEQFWREFRQGLRDLGYVEGQNIRFEFRSAEGHLDRLPELAAELVHLKVDIIVTWFTPTALAAKQATHEIPIVMAETGDPIGTGLVASLPRPGGNVTGMASVAAELAGKSVQLIRDMLPSARRVTALANATDPFSKPFLEQIKLGGEATGTTINVVGVSNTEEFESAFAGMEQDRPDAVIVQPSLPTKRAAELAVKHRVPAVSVPRWFAEEGGLMSYSAKYDELFRKAAVYVDKILKGTRPADLPVEQPTHFELVINLKTARALGLEISPTLLARADEVIE
jgi:ABC-type uncharacterized transport system substrate-binding protein